MNERTKSVFASLGQYKHDDGEVIGELKDLYKDKLLNIERNSKFHKFHHPEILEAELAAKPTVLLIGQYSTGKTTFIKHLIGMEYVDHHIGPEPTTDRFVAVVYGEEAKKIDGNACTGVNTLPFSGLSTFGTSFLNKFYAAVVPAPLLNHINLIDTPGVLSGEKQRTSRGYDFAKVSRWFAERCDLILLMFDCSKLDISDEFKSVIEELQPHEDKVHCVLNKADQLDSESLMRVYGALLWSMGRIFKGAEVSRIYVGSFTDAPLIRNEHAELFHKDELVLKGHIAELPKACSMRKINDIVKRIRLAVVHLCVLGHLRSRMPYLWGQNYIQSQLIEKLHEVFEEVRVTYQLSEGDFPRLDRFKAQLQMEDFYTFPKLDRRVLTTLQNLLTEDIPRIINLVAGAPDGPLLLDDDEEEDDEDEDDEEDEDNDDVTDGESRDSKSRDGNDEKVKKIKRVFPIKSVVKGRGKRQPVLFTISENDNEFHVAWWFIAVFLLVFISVVIGLYSFRNYSIVYSNKFLSPIVRIYRWFVPWTTSTVGGALDSSSIVDFVNEVSGNTADKVTTTSQVGMDGSSIAMETVGNVAKAGFVSNMINSLSSSAGSISKSSNDDINNDSSSIAKDKEKEKAAKRKLMEQKEKEKEKERERERQKEREKEKQREKERKEREERERKEREEKERKEREKEQAKKKKLAQEKATLERAQEEKENNKDGAD